MEIASLARSSDEYVTKPKPREREGSSRSMMTAASTISPNCEKNLAEGAGYRGDVLMPFSAKIRPWS